MSNAKRYLINSVLIAAVLIRVVNAGMMSRAMKFNALWCVVGFLMGAGTVGSTNNPNWAWLFVLGALGGGGAVLIGALFEWERQFGDLARRKPKE
jgi:hypothetical protein